MTNLPLLVHPQNRLPMGLALLGWIILMYVLPNNFLIVPATEVPLTVVDHWVPLQPRGWAWVYISYYFYLISVYFFVRDERNLNQFYYSMSISAVIAALIFFLLPTSIDRSLYPLLQVQSSSEWILWFIRKIDNSINCAPSMHIAMTTIAALTALSESRKPTVFMIIWALLIGYSTMATKQHYFIDVIGGFVFGVCTYGVFSRARFYIISSRIASN